MPYSTPEKQHAYYLRKGKKITYEWRKKYRRWNDYQREYARTKRGTTNFRFKDWEEKPPIDFDKLRYYEIKLLNQQIDSNRKRKPKERRKSNEIKIVKKTEEVNKINWAAIAFYANKTEVVRPKAQYTNSRSPFGIADELHSLNNHVDQ